jgi:NADH dehydrogenase (ubiquinone) Fe-S protein 3
MTFIKKNNAYNLLTYLLKLLPYKFIKKVVYKEKENIISFFVTKENLQYFLLFLKNHSLLQFQTLIGITAVDYPEKLERFEINYFLLSYKLNLRIIIKTTTNDVTPIDSIYNIYKSAV